MSRTHGLASTYVDGCRCDKCREAHRVRHAASRAALAARPRDQVPHGTSGGYDNWLCRCEKCTAAKKARNAASRRARKLQAHVVVTVALAGLAGGLVGADAAVIAHRGGHIARPAVVAPAPERHPSPVLVSTTGGTR